MERKLLQATNKLLWPTGITPNRTAREAQRTKEQQYNTQGLHVHICWNFSAQVHCSFDVHSKRIRQIHKHWRSTCSSTSHAGQKRENTCTINIWRSSWSQSSKETKAQHKWAKLISLTPAHFTSAFEPCAYNQVLLLQSISSTITLYILLPWLLNYCIYLLWPLLNHGIYS